MAKSLRNVETSDEALGSIVSLYFAGLLWLHGIVHYLVPWIGYKVEVNIDRHWL
jgi:hypothetical protein